MRLLLSLAALVAALLSFPATAADPTYVFAVPPRESAAKAQQVYEPIANFLSRSTGRQFALRYTDNWLSYEDDMRKNRYDLVFDGPAFIAWRIEALGHAPLVRFAPDLKFTLVAKEGNDRMNEPKNLVGRAVCAFPPPFLPTLLLNDLFPNAARQPILVRVPTLKDMYDGVVSGRCQAAMLNDAILKKLDGDSHKVKAIYHSKPVPNQGFTASPRIPPEVKQKIIQALMSPQGEQATTLLRQEFGGASFVPADAKGYAGFGVLLKDMWGFNR